MLIEVEKTRQLRGEPGRRWFNDDAMDLIVWSHREQIIGFQLSYDKPHNEKALSWKRGKGFLHERVDDGFRPGRHKGTPILFENGVFELSRVLEDFASRAVSIDPRVASFVTAQIKKYAA